MSTPEIVNSPPPLLKLLELRRNGRAIALLGTLMLASAITEGVGLVLVVPVLGVLGAAGGSQTPIMTALAAIGVPLALGPLLALFVILVSVRALLNYARTMAAQRFEIALVDGLRQRAWRALLHCDWRALQGLRRSDSASLLISEIDRIGYGMSQLIAALAGAITLAAVGLAALAISPLVAGLAALAGAAVLLAYRGMRQRAVALGAALGTAYAQVHGNLGEGLSALRVIKSLGREAEAEQASAAGFAGLRQAQLAFWRAQGRGQVALQAGGALALALLIWLAIARWHLGAATILPLVALFVRAVPLLGVVQEVWLNWSHARSAITSAQSLIDRAEAAREPDAVGIMAPALTRSIVLTDVTVEFAGASAPALDGITLTIPAHGIIALTGPSGAGKSTLADLLGGLLSPDRGTVVIDGAVLEGRLRQAWRMRVAYVQQEPVLLAANIADNLRWAAPEASPAQLENALHDAAAEFVFALPQGLETRVGDGGRALSGGERQRLMLARALLRDPALLILDEATSALDPVNEALISAALARLRSRMAVVIICHRGALLTLADRVVRLESGRIVAIESPGETG